MVSWLKAPQKAKRAARAGIMGLAKAAPAEIKYMGKPLTIWRNVLSFLAAIAIAGFAISALLGSVAVGPMYAAFPFARTLLNKGTSLFNVIVSLTMWAADKIPTVMMEAKFMGAEFALLRLGLTVAASVAIAWVMQRLPSPQVPAQPSMIEDRAGLRRNRRYLGKPGTFLTGLRPKGDRRRPACHQRAFRRRFRTRRFARLGGCRLGLPQIVQPARFAPQAAQPCRSG